MTDNLNKIISIPARKLADSYKNLETSHIFHSYKILGEDCVRQFYYIKKENFTNLTEFYLASHKLSLKEYEFNNCMPKFSETECKINSYSDDEIEEIFHDDMLEDEFHRFHLSRSDDLYTMINTFEPAFINHFYSIFTNYDEDLVVYQGEYELRKLNDYILWNSHYTGYITSC